MKYFAVDIRQPRNSAHPKKRARQALLSLVLNRQPKSLTALAELTGRQAPNLSRIPADDGKLRFDQTEARRAQCRTRGSGDRVPDRVE